MPVYLHASREYTGTWSPSAYPTDIGLISEGGCKKSLQADTFDQESRVQPAYKIYQYQIT